MPCSCVPMRRRHVGMEFCRAAEESRCVPTGCRHVWMMHSGKKYEISEWAATCGIELIETNDINANLIIKNYRLYYDCVIRFLEKFQVIVLHNAQCLYLNGEDGILRKLKSNPSFHETPNCKILSWRDLAYLLHHLRCASL